MKKFYFTFVEKRKIFYALSIILMIASLASVLIQGMNFGIDFTGGTNLHISVDKQVKIADVRQALEKTGHGGDQIQELADGTFQIKTQFMQQDKQNEYVKTISDQLGKTEVLQATAVGPTIGQEILQKGLIALFIAMVLMIAYITVRFEWRFAITGIISLFHDVFITIGLFSIFQWEVNVTFVAAILTIFGYSINDTIVIFDRIRENLGRVKRQDLAHVVNDSISATLRRSLVTSISTLLPLIAVFLFGGDTTRYFVLAMIIGIASGAYSSIGIAAPMWYDFSMASKRKRF
ncbi:protein translocase subunit SecF [Peptococcus simiae]|uniref:Protein-export membrane protein SecF n=1 Tax=Peptococcus simiae TaxID=1643805 RepID=A0ABW9GWR0_9FIRM